MAENSGTLRQLFKSIGPGLLFAGAAIGISHLVLSTRAGAHYGMVFFWVILIALLLKYPLFAFGPRYAAATGHSLLHAYREQGRWALWLFTAIISINMFAVTGAVAAVCGGLLATLFGLGHLSMPLLTGLILVATAILLIIGRYRALDQFMKLLSLVLLLTVLVAFVAVLVKGPGPVNADLVEGSIWEGAGLTLLISLLGWMPAGMEASVMNSIWNVEKVRSEGYRPNLRQTLFDFNLGYALTALLAFAFLTIGAFTVYGSGQQLGGNSVQFTNQLLQLFTGSLGQWSYPVIAIAAFGAIYSTLITVWDAYARSWMLSLAELRRQGDAAPSNRQYTLYLLLIGGGGFLLFQYFSASMLRILEAATITAFMTAPIIGYLNLKAILSPALSPADRPGKGELLLARLGLFFMAGFSIYYLYDLLIVPRFS